MPDCHVAAPGIKSRLRASDAARSADTSASARLDTDHGSSARQLSGRTRGSVRLSVIGDQDQTVGGLAEPTIQPLDVHEAVICRRRNSRISCASRRCNIAANSGSGVFVHRRGTSASLVGVPGHRRGAVGAAERRGLPPPRRGSAGGCAAAPHSLRCRAPPGNSGGPARPTEARVKGAAEPRAKRSLDARLDVLGGSAANALRAASEASDRQIRCVATVSQRWAPP